MGTSPFWYDAYKSNSGAVYSINGEDPTLMDTMTVFSNNEFNTSLASLDPDKVYCAVANLHSSLGFGFSYRWIDCDNGNTNTASRLCFKEPVACLTPASPPAPSSVSPPASATTTMS